MPTQNLNGIPLFDYGILPASVTNGSLALNASNNAIAGFFQYEGGHGAIVGAVYNCQAITSPPVYRLGLQGITSRATPDGTVKGSGTAKFDLTPTVGAAQTVTFDSPFTGSAGDALALVIAYLSGTVGASNTATFATRVNAMGPFYCPYAATQTAGTWAAVQGLPYLSPIYNDGYVGRRCNCPKSYVSLAPTNASNPLYYGNLFTPAMAGVLSGAYMMFRPVAGSTFTLSLFEGSNTTPVSTTSFNPDLLSFTTAAIGPHFIPVPSYSMLAGTTYRLVFSMTSSTAFGNCVGNSYNLLAHHVAAVGAPVFATTAPSGAASWTNYDGTVANDYRVYPIIPCIDSFVGSGFLPIGGGLVA